MTWLGKIKYFFQKTWYSIVLDIRHWRNVIRYRNAYLTDTGRCLIAYCNRILAGEIDEHNRIESYEDKIMEVQDYVYQHTTFHLSREETCQAMIQALNVYANGTDYLEN